MTDSIQELSSLLSIQDKVATQEETKEAPVPAEETKEALVQAEETKKPPQDEPAEVKEVNTNESIPEDVIDISDDDETADEDDIAPTPKNTKRKLVLPEDWPSKIQKHYQFDDDNCTILIVNTVDKKQGIDNTTVYSVPNFKISLPQRRMLHELHQAVNRVSCSRMLKEVLQLVADANVSQHECTDGTWGLWDEQEENWDEIDGSRLNRRYDSHVLIQAIID